MSSSTGSMGAAGELRATELMADISLLRLRSGDSCNLTRLPLQEGVDLLIWSGRFADPLHLVMRDDSNRVHFTYVLQGKAHCELHKHCGCETHEVREGAGIIHFGPDRRGRYCQQGDYASVTVMVRPDILTSCCEDDDGALRQAVETGNGCFLGGFRGAELHATACSLNRSVHAGARAGSVSARSRFWVEGQGLSLLGLFLESQKQLPETMELTASDRLKLLRAKDMLLANLSKAPLLSELAEHSGLSLLKLKRGFKALFGNSVYGLFMAERMHEAKRRLAASALTVTEVAMDLGYTNVSHFAAAFRKQIGVTPASIRARK